MPHRTSQEPDNATKESTNSTHQNLLADAFHLLHSSASESGIPDMIKPTKPAGTIS